MLSSYSSMATLKNRAAELLLLCSFLLLWSSRLVDGVQEDISLTREEELEIENEFRRLNKRAVKTVKTSYGDLYDCVDFYKQPAFDNPLLKNHAFHPGMRPSGHRSLSKRMRRNTRSKHGQTKFETVDCPFGTVPIRRVTKEELVRTKLNKKRYALSHGVHSPSDPGFYHAIVRTKFDANKKYNGGSAYITIFNVTIEDPRQYSLARMSLRGGTDSIQVGTQTNPAIYNNLETRVFIRTKTSTEDEFNLRSKSFVQVLRDRPIDLRVVNVTVRGVRSVNERFSIERDYDSGDWWFYLGDGTNTLLMGFWPSASFTGGLQGLATGLDWGGEVSGPEDIPPARMGSGKCPHEETEMDAYCVLMKVITEAKQEIDVVDTERFYDNLYYNVIDEGVVSPNDGHLMFFGGPGQGTTCGSE